MKIQLITALKKTTPIFFGYIFVGIAFGLLLTESGYGILWALFISLAVYSGSLQFILIPFICNPVSILTIIITSAAVSSRHLFYGISFIERFKKMGAKKWYMIYALTDETYSVLCSIKNDKHLYDNDRVLFLISFLNQLYWVAGSVLGSIIGINLPFNAEGIDFALTALFLVILIELIKSSKKAAAAIIGVACAVVCVLIFGKENFLLPSFSAASVALVLLKSRFYDAEREKQ